MIQTLTHLPPNSGPLPSLGLWVEMGLMSLPNSPQAGTGGVTLNTCPEPAGCESEKGAPNVLPTSVSLQHLHYVT